MAPQAAQKKLAPCKYPDTTPIKVNTTTPTLLLIEDDESLSSIMKHVLEDEGFAVTTAMRGDEGLSQATKQLFDVVISDVNMPGTDGIELVRSLHQTQPHLPIIVMTGYGTTETAINAMKYGAFDYILKPFRMDEMLALTQRALSTAKERLEKGVPVAAPTAESNKTQDEATIIGSSRAMQEVFKSVGRVASKPITVLIRGETGTGKELIARAIYQHSERSNRPFVTVNCAAIPESLLESELFGHERGAFTSADQQRIGRFEQADQGTIFLDEIGEMSLSTQAKLLRVLQEHTIQRVGGKEDIVVDVRVLAATNRPLEDMIREKQFREDLFYRLNVVVISPPPLRERREDIPPLTRYFMRRFSKELQVPDTTIQQQALSYLESLPWPGNVRQLENVIRKFLILAQGYTVTVDHIKQAMDGSVPILSARKPVTDNEDPIKEIIANLLEQARRGIIEAVDPVLTERIEKELYGQAISLAHGNQAKASRWIGVSRVTMNEKLKRYHLHPSQRFDGSDAKE
jgi:nitrogen regulation protein NR(I)